MTIECRIGPIAVHMVADRAPDDATRPNYIPFLHTATSAPDLSLQVRVAAAPLRSHDRLIAELPKNWGLYRCGQRWRLEILDQVTFQPNQVALFDSTFRTGEVYLVPDPAMPAGSWYLAPVMTTLLQWWLAGALAKAREGLVVHGSAVSIGGAGLAFIGESGAGKTTIARWCRDAGGAKVLNDERILITKSTDGFNVTGTPWHGEWAELSAETAPLAGLFVLRKGHINCFEPLGAVRMLTGIVPEAFLPIWDDDGMVGMLETAECVVRSVPSGELRFRHDSTVADHLVEYVRGLGAGEAAVRS